MDSPYSKRVTGSSVHELNSTLQKTAESNSRTVLNHYKRQSSALSLNIVNGRVFVIEDARQLRRFADVLRRDDEKNQILEMKMPTEKASLWFNDKKLCFIS